MHAAAPWSSFLKGISATVVVLLLGASLLVLATVPAGPWRFMAAVPALIVLAAAAFAVRGYALHGSVLLVRRPW